MDITKYFQRSERQRIDSQIIESLPLASSSSALEEEETDEFVETVTERSEVSERLSCCLGTSEAEASEFSETTSDGVSSVTSVATNTSSDLPVPVSETHKHGILTQGPTQPRNCSFPKRKFSNGWLSFKPDWYDIKEAEGWLEYSVQNDRMYCLACRLFTTELTEKNERNWISTGVCNWKKGVEKIKNHFKCKQHKNAVGAQIHYLSTNSHVDIMLDRNCKELLSKRQQEVANNRRYLARLVDVARTLAKCGLAFRGHNEKEDSPNRGNFVEVVTLLSHWDDTLAEYMESGARNCTYLSNRAQNDLIAAMAKYVLGKIVEEAKLAQELTVMMDETTDVSGKEQVSVMIRFVDGEGNVQERLLGFCVVDRPNAENLFQILKDTLAKHDLSISNVIGQCYDGASTMSGKYHGVQPLLKDEVPKAIYVHCYGHCLNLVLTDAVKRNKTARNFFGTLESLYCFLRLSNCRNALFHKLQQEFKESEESQDRSLTIKKLCETRWACRYESVRALQANLPIVIQLLNLVIEDSSSLAKAVADARGLLHQIESFEFLLAMVVLKSLLEHTNVLSKYLQSIQLDLGAAVSTVNSTLCVLKQLRNDSSFKQYYDNASSLSSELLVEVPTILSSRRRKVSRQLDDMWQNEHHHGTLESRLRVEFYYQVLDVMIEQIEQRFSQETNHLLLCFNYLQPEKLLRREETAEEDCKDSLTYLGNYYGLDVTALIVEYSLFKESRRDCLQTCTTALDVLKVFLETGLHRVYTQLYKLYKILVTLPITTASCERSFSKLTIVKNKLRSTTLQDRLENLMILFVENDITNTIPYDSVIDSFVAMGPRRMHLTQ